MQPLLVSPAARCTPAAQRGDCGWVSSRTPRPMECSLGGGMSETPQKRVLVTMQLLAGDHAACEVVTREGQREGSHPGPQHRLRHHLHWPGHSEATGVLTAVVSPWPASGRLGPPKVGSSSRRGRRHRLRLFYLPHMDTHPSESLSSPLAPTALRSACCACGRHGPGAGPEQETVQRASAQGPASSSGDGRRASEGTRALGRGLLHPPPRNDRRSTGSGPREAQLSPLPSYSRMGHRPPDF